MAERPHLHEIAVLGGGVLGCAVAHGLARHKVAAVVVDRSGPAREWAPGAAAAVWDHTDSVAARWGLESTQQFPQLQETLGPVGYRRTGGMSPTFTDAEAEAGQTLARTQASTGLPVRWLSAAEALQREPALAADVRGATYSPHEAVVDPTLLSRRLRAAAQRAGATFLYHAGHVSIAARSRSFLLRGARESVEAHYLIVTAGEWLVELDRQIGLGASVRTVGGHVVVTDPQPAIVRHRLPGLRQQPGGEMVLAGAAGDRGDCTAAARAARDTTSAAARIVPALRAVRVLHAWPWRATCFADALPLLGEIGDGVFAAVPHVPGLTLVPLLAHAVSALATGGRAPDGLEAWDARRLRPAAWAAPRKDSQKDP